MDMADLDSMDKANNDFRILAEHFHITFSSPTGVKVLDHLREMVYQSSLVPNQMMDSQAEINPAEFVFVREGQGQVFRYIERLIKYYGENR